MARAHRRGSDWLALDAPYQATEMRLPPRLWGQSVRRLEPWPQAWLSWGRMRLKPCEVVALGCGKGWNSFVQWSSDSRQQIASVSRPARDCYFCRYPRVVLFEDAFRRSVYVCVHGDDRGLYACRWLVRYEEALPRGGARAFRLAHCQGRRICWFLVASCALGGGRVLRRPFLGPPADFAGYCDIRKREGTQAKAATPATQDPGSIWPQRNKHKLTRADLLN